jgi:uncharacterized cysteine cluster protein YcgN (CxxCxxCC family)
VTILYLFRRFGIPRQKNLATPKTTLEKIDAKTWTPSVCNFQKTAQRKQSPNWRKFAQSGHPVRGYYILMPKSVLPNEKVSIAQLIRRNIEFYNTDPN